MHWFIISAIFYFAEYCTAKTDTMWIKSHLPIEHRYHNKIRKRHLLKLSSIHKANIHSQSESIDRQLSNEISIDNDGSKKEKVLFLETAENCPDPRDGILNWEPAENEVYSEGCKTTLNSMLKKNNLLEVTRPATKGYPFIRGFFHVTLNVTSYLNRDRHMAIFEVQIQKLAKSNLLEHAQLVVRIGLLDKDRNRTLTNCVKELLKARVDFLAKGTEIEFINPLQYECSTIQSLRFWCDFHKNGFVFYLHNKGFTHGGQPSLFSFVKDWREFMMFFLFERWELCANSLTHGAATCGVFRRVPRKHEK